MRRAKAVVGNLIDAAAAEKKEATKQATGVMDAARRRPAVGAAQDRRGAELAADARKLFGDCRERLVPGHFEKAVAAGTFLALAPSLPNGGPRYAQVRVHHRGNGFEHRRWRGIAREWLATDNPAVLDQGRIGAPVGERREACDVHGSHASHTRCTGQLLTHYSTAETLQGMR